MVEYILQQAYSGALLVSLPGIVVAFPMLWSAAGARRGLFLALVLFWLLVLPWAVLWAVESLSPGILGLGYTYDGVEFFVRLWLPGTLALPGFAGVVWLWVKFRSEGQGQTQSKGLM